MKEKILLIDDDASLLRILEYQLTEAGFGVEAVSSGDEGMDIFNPEEHALVITDVKMKGASGMEVLERIRERHHDTPVIILTAYGTIEKAVQAVKAGAFDFIQKPISRDYLIITVEKAIAMRRLAEENILLKERLERAGGEPKFIATSPSMLEIMRLLNKVSPTDATILLTGESGTGKELLARQIHRMSRRRDGPFVVVNCAAIPRELLEAELFGHTRGSFTGAIRERRGKFIEATGGTLFLDEVSELYSELQTKILRAIQEREVEPIGSSKVYPVDIRIIAVTNIDLLERVKEGRFREDLFFRLNVIPVRVPPLRERKEDIPVLFRYFLKRYGASADLKVDKEVYGILKNYPFPGNVREMENMCQRLVILKEGNKIGPEDLPREILEPVAGEARSRRGEREGEEGKLVSLPEEGLSLHEIEKRIIEEALKKEGGNISRAARFLKIPRYILIYRMKKYGIRAERD